MDILSPQLTEFLENLVPPRPPELKKMEAYAEERDFPIIGPICGHLCYQIARTLGAKRIFEMGSGFGYSTAWFARAVQENGGSEVCHVVWDEELSNKARVHLKALGYENMVKYVIGEAIQTLHAASGTFDLIFMDIDKQDYVKAVPVIYDKLRVNGILIIDNILWSGRIFDENDQSPATNAIREITGMLTNNDRWLTSVIPVRDGLLVATKLK
ncbi:MAG TPA: O-methyltransferase [Anaerolineales bacterium]|nr:O-methyltransferase [Anaerolineales bacterium]